MPMMKRREGERTEQVVSVLPEDEPKPIRLGWKIYEEAWPVWNDVAVMCGITDKEEAADMYCEETQWGDCSRKNLNLRFRITDRVSCLMDARGIERGNSSVWSELCYLCRDACETAEDVAVWEIPEGWTPNPNGVEMSLGMRIVSVG